MSEEHEEQERVTDYLRGCAASETEVRKMLYEEYRVAAIQMLVTEMLLRNASEADSIRETLIDLWKEAVMKRNDEGVERLRELIVQADPDDPMIAACDPDQQGRYIEALVQETEIEIRQQLQLPS
jgi:hypothetical protein